MNSNKLWIGYAVLGILTVIAGIFADKNLAYALAVGASILGFMAFASN
jgi:uncharacterized membrane protein HdeD (DUF308 family)